jgi:hypothetical protein
MSGDKPSEDRANRAKGFWIKRQDLCAWEMADAFAAEEVALAVEAAKQEVWEECVSAMCDNCRNFSWPINDQDGNLFHVHEDWTESRKCAAEALFNLKSREIHERGGR